MSYWDPDFEEWMKRFFRRPGYGIGGRDISWELEQMRKEIEKMFRESLQERPLETPKELVREYKTPEGGKVREIGPIVYGYSVTIGPDGRPRVREFGNVRRLGGFPVPKLSAEREPMADVITNDKEVKVVVELPGIEKKDIMVNAKEGSVQILAETPERKYRRDIEIPSDADIESAKSTYKNGILEIVFQRKPTSKGTSIPID